MLDMFGCFEAIGTKAAVKKLLLFNLTSKVERGIGVVYEQNPRRHETIYGHNERKG